MTRLITRFAVIAVIVCAAIPLLAASVGSGSENGKPPTLAALQTLVDNGDYDAALTQSETLLDQQVDNRDARFLHAVALAGLDRNDDAIKAFKSLAEAWPDRPEPANNLAALYARRGDYKQARKWLKKALNTRKVYAVAHRNLGDVYTALATMAYSRVLEGGDKTPDNKGIQLALVNHMYSPRTAGLQLPAATTTAATPQPTASSQAAKPEPQPAYEKQAASAQRPAATAAESSEDEAAPSADDKQIVQTIYAWAKAWSNQDYDAYVGYYTQDYPRDGDTSRKKWLAERNIRVTRKASIEVHVVSPEINPIDTDHVRVTFIQTYQSPSYSDKSRKWLLLQRTDAGWRIARETSTLLSRG